MCHERVSVLGRCGLGGFRSVHERHHRQSRQTAEDRAEEWNGSGSLRHPEELLGLEVVLLPLELRSLEPDEESDRLDALPVLARLDAQAAGFADPRVGVSVSRDVLSLPCYLLVRLRVLLADDPVQGVCAQRRRDVC